MYQAATGLALSPVLGPLARVPGVRLLGMHRSVHVQFVMPSITEQCLEIGASVLSGSSAGNLADRFVLAATVAMACREGPEGNTASQVADQACEIPSETHSAGLSLGVNAEHGVPIRVGFPYHGLGFRVSTGHRE